MDLIKINEYCDFLAVLTPRLKKFFDNQKEYICCKPGCSLCCQKGEYPCSQLEFEVVRFGFSQLPSQIRGIVEKNISDLKKEKQSFNGEHFIYRCPFLINDYCSIYQYRMIICRTFGLPYYVEENGNQRIKTPFCVEQGLNYSEVYDKDNKVISDKLFREKGFEVEPVAFNLSQSFIKNKLGKKVMELDFGEEKSLIDWFL